MRTLTPFLTNECINVTQKIVYYLCVPFRSYCLFVMYGPARAHSEDEIRPTSWDGFHYTAALYRIVHACRTHFQLWRGHCSVSRCTSVILSSIGFQILEIGVLPK